MEGVDEVAFYLGLDDFVVDADQEKVLVFVEGGVVEFYRGEDDAFLPAFDGVDDVVADKAFKDFVILLEHEVLEAGAELGAHEAFAGAGAEDLEDAFVDVGVFVRGDGGYLRAAGAALELKGKLEAFAEEVEVHGRRSRQLMKLS